MTKRRLLVGTNYICEFKENLPRYHLCLSHAPETTQCVCVCIVVGLKHVNGVPFFIFYFFSPCSPLLLWEDMYMEVSPSFSWWLSSMGLKMVSLTALTWFCHDRCRAPVRKSVGGRYESCSVNISLGHFNGFYLIIWKCFYKYSIEFLTAS